MASITTFATIALVLTDTTLDTNACILATLARSLTITTLLALTAPLAAGLGRKVLVIGTELMLEVERCSRWFARLRRKRCWRHRWLARAIGLRLGLGR